MDVRDKGQSVRNPKPAADGMGQGDGWTVAIVLLVLAITSGLILFEAGYFGPRTADINVSLPKVDTRR